MSVGPFGSDTGPMGTVVSCTVYCREREVREREREREREGVMTVLLLMIILSLIYHVLMSVGPFGSDTGPMGTVLYCIL